MALGPDFRRLRFAYGISELGTALSVGALPLIATLVLHAPVLQVSLLAALAGLAGAALAVPLGPWVEFRRKRPVMIGADLVRCAAVISVPLAAAAGVLSYAQLCLVAMIQTAGGIVFTSASGAHLKALVPPQDRADANGRLETTLWTVYSVGPAAGGALISWLGATVTLAVDGVSFLLSALGVSRLRCPEPAPPHRHPAPRGREIAAGWHYIWTHRDLRALYLNTLLFGGCVMASAPLLTVLMLRELGFPPWQYGVTLGAVGLGGICGALAGRPLRRRYSPRPVLLGFGAARALWLGLFALIPAGVPGLLVASAAQFGMVFCAGGFNPVLATHRMEATDDGHLSRVLSAWSVSSRVAQPLMTAAGGVLAAAIGTRAALAVLAVLLLGSVALLPWRPVRPRVAPAGPGCSP